MKVLFFIVVWTIVAVAWYQVDVKLTDKWYSKYVEVLVLLPVTVWYWFKEVVRFIKEKLNG